MDSPSQVGDCGRKEFQLNVKVAVLKMVVNVGRAARMLALDTCNFLIGWRASTLSLLTEISI